MSSDAGDWCRAVSVHRFTSVTLASFRFWGQGQRSGSETDLATWRESSEKWTVITTIPTLLWLLTKNHSVVVTINNNNDNNNNDNTLFFSLKKVTLRKSGCANVSTLVQRRLGIYRYGTAGHWTIDALPDSYCYIVFHGVYIPYWAGIGHLPTHCGLQSLSGSKTNRWMIEYGRVYFLVMSNERFGSSVMAALPVPTIETCLYCCSFGKYC